ncbi:MAG: hypothetical protein AAB551_03800 [Patescibacteria group bacterium]
MEKSKIFLICAVISLVIAIGFITYAANFFSGASENPALADSNAADNATLGNNDRRQGWIFGGIGAFLLIDAAVFFILSRKKEELGECSPSLESQHSQSGFEKINANPSRSPPEYCKIHLFGEV